MEFNNDKAHSYGGYLKPDFPKPGSKVDTPAYLPPEPIHGTTTVALKFDGGVLLGADNRASAGYMVASPTAKKLHKLAKSSAMSIAGGVADAQYVVKLMRAEISIYELNRGAPMPARMIGSLFANMLFGQYRSMFPYFIGPIMAGVDEKGSYVFPIDISGAITSEPFTSTGSGSPYALGVLQAMYEDNMSLDDAKKLALIAIRSAIIKDIASGDGMDLLVITTEGITEVSKDEMRKILGDKYPFR